MLRITIFVMALLGLAACADGARELTKPVQPLGDFKLGHAIVVAPNIVKGPASREATPEEWIAGVDAALEERFRRYEGDRFYHIGVSVEGYVLAHPGVPLVFSPKSVMILNATVWDDAKGVKLNPEPEQITVLEAVSGNTLLGSGLTQTKEAQLEVLSVNAALQIEKWMRRMQRDEGWFGGLQADATTAPEAADMAESDPNGDLAAPDGDPGVEELPIAAE